MNNLPDDEGPSFWHGVLLPIILVVAGCVCTVGPILYIMHVETNRLEGK